MATEPTGLAAALAPHVPDQVEEQPEQLDLDPVAALPLFEPVKDARAPTGGRPKGAINKSTRALADYVLKRHRHPVIAAAQVCDMPLAELARQLCCSRLDAANHQQKCREFVARYTLQAMPQQVQFNGETVGQLMIVNLNAPRAGEEEGKSPFAIDITPAQQNQALSNEAAASPHGQSPHDGKSENGNNELDQ